MRIVVLAVLLPTVAAVCVFVLVLAGVLHPRIAQMALAGGSILVVAILAAAISALGPKYRPTPLLTPLFAGIFAALLTTTAVYAAHAHIRPNRAAVAAVLPPKPAVRPVKVAPVIEKATIEPDLREAPAAPMQPAIEAAALVGPAKVQDQLSAASQPAARAEVGAPPADAAGNAVGGPLVTMANAVVTPAAASEKPAAGDAGKPPVVMARIPTPVTAPEAIPAADAPLNLQARFDPTGPREPDADGPPMELDVADAQPATAVAHASIPPLPRIRPCGAAGPACP